MKHSTTAQGKLIRYRFFSGGTQFSYDPLLRSALARLHNTNFTLKEDYNNPEYIIVHCFPVAFQAFMRSYTTKALKDKVTIFFATEAMHPDFNLFDYCISYIDEDFRYLYNAERYFVFGQQLGMAKLAHLTPIADIKQQFCNFIYSHEGTAERTEIFHSLSKYRKVDSPGKYLNNMGNKPDRWKTGGKPGELADDWFASSIVQKRPYKFSVAFENSSIQGYASEKIISSFLAGTIPIYWGDPSIGRIFYEDSFINCHAYKNFKEVSKRVEEIDQNNELWLEIVNRPKLKPGYYEALQKQSDLQDILANIFAKEKKDVLVKPKGALFETVFQNYYQLSYRSMCWALGRALSKKLRIHWIIKPLVMTAENVYHRLIKR